MISDMMAIKAVSALFCDQLSSVLPGDKAMVKGEEACLSCGFSFRIHIHKGSTYI